MALAAKKGELHPDKMNPKYRKGIMKTADNMSMEDLEKYCHSEVKD
jgi:hypothetical protein